MNTDAFRKLADREISAKLLKDIASVDQDSHEVELPSQSGRSVTRSTARPERARSDAALFYGDAVEKSEHA
jgi:hypothetical protein